MRPELVVEIAFNDVQESSQYPGGMALRFARVKGYRPDKRPEEADTIDTVRAIYEQQSCVKTLAEWLAFIERQHPQPIALGLDRVREVLARMKSACRAR